MRNLQPQSDPLLWLTGPQLDWQMTPKNHTVDESTMGQQDFNLIIDPADQENNNNQGADPEIMCSDYSTDPSGRFRMIR